MLESADGGERARRAGEPVRFGDSIMLRATRALVGRAAQYLSVSSEGVGGEANGEIEEEGAEEGGEGEEEEEGGEGEGEGEGKGEGEGEGEGEGDGESADDDASMRQADEEDEGSDEGAGDDECEAQCASGVELSTGGARAVWSLERGHQPGPLRVGFQVAMRRGLAEKALWYGRGPHESYPDRHAGARVGLWEGAVAEQTHRYVRPQENGNKFECRWLALSDKSGRAGTLVLAAAGESPPLSMQCHHFELDDFDTLPDTRTPRVRHGASLQPRDLTTLCVDGALAGVGGIDSWGSLPLAQHRIALETPIAWRFWLYAFDEAEGPADTLARRLRAEAAAEARRANAIVSMGGGAC